MELFGLHEFALLKPDALRPLVSLDDCPNKTVRVFLGMFFEIFLVYGPSRMQVQCILRTSSNVLLCSIFTDIGGALQLSGKEETYCQQFKRQRLKILILRLAFSSSTSLTTFITERRPPPGVQEQAVAAHDRGGREGSGGFAESGCGHVRGAPGP